LRRELVLGFLGLIAVLYLLASSCSVELVGDGVLIRDLRVVLADGSELKLYPGKLAWLGEIAYGLSEIFSWIEPGDRVFDGFEDGDYNGWSLDYDYNGISGSAALHISDGNLGTIPTCDPISGSYMLEYACSFKSGSGWSFVDGSAWVSYGFNLTCIGRLSFRCWVRLHADRALSSFYVKQYVKVNQSGTITTYYGQSESLSGVSGWGDWTYLSYDFTFDGQVDLIEFGFYIYARKSSPSDYTTYGCQVCIDDVEVYATVSKFRVTCDYSISGRYVKSYDGAPLDTCNYTITICHNVDVNSSWIEAAEYNYNASLPLTVTGWSSNWHDLMGLLKYMVEEGSWTIDGYTYNYRLAINVTDRSGSDLLDYQVKISIDTSSLVEDGYATTSGCEVRFTDEEGNVIPHYRENSFNSSETVYWVKVPLIPANSTTIIYMYFDPDLTSVPDSSNASSVFIRYDDFESYDVGSPPSSASGWVVLKGDPVVVDGGYSGKGLEVSNVDVRDCIALLFDQNYSGVSVHFYYKIDGIDLRNGYYMFKEGTAYITTTMKESGSEKWYDGSAYNDFNPALSYSANVWHEYEYIFTFSDFKVRKDGSLYDAGLRSTPINGVDRFVWDTYSANKYPHTYVIDNVYVRKYVDPEPEVLVKESTGSHDYYIKVQLDVYGIDVFTGEVVHSSSYVILKLELTWQLFAGKMVYRLRIIDTNLTPVIRISSEGVSLSIMISVLDLAAIFFSRRDEE